MNKFFTDRHLFIIFSAIMLAGFYFNAYKTASNDFFYYHQRDSEALIIGRMIEKSDNTLSPPGIMMSISVGTYQDAHHVDATYDLYLNNKAENGDKFSLYNGQFGLQSHILYALHSTLKFLNIDNKSIFKSLQFSVAALLAFTLSGLLVLFRRHFGIQSSMLACFLIATSPWLTVFARNLYWVPFTWFLPILAAWWYYVEKKQNFFSNRKSALVISILLFIKFLCGLEYITAIAGSVLIIAIYGMIINNNSLRVIINNLIILIASSSLALAASIIAHILQDAYYSGSLLESVSVFTKRVAYRAYGDPDKFTGVISDSLNSDIIPILNMYWSKGEIFNFLQLFSLNAREIIIPFIFIVLLLYSTVLFFKKDKLSIQKITALNILVFGTLMASISWFLVGKAHSYIHTHMNYVLWHITFMIFAGPVCIALFRILFPRTFAYIAPVTLVAAIIAINHVFPTHLDTTKTFKKFELSNGNLSLMNNGVYFEFNCNQIEDFNERFFLHIYVPQTYMPASNIQNEFINMDFDWSEQRTSNIFNEYLSSKCTAFVRTSGDISLNQLPISAVQFGQFRAKGDLVRLWEKTLDMKDQQSLKNRMILIEDYTDHQWTNGFHNSKNAFFVKNSFENRQLLGFSKGVTIGNHNYDIEHLSIGDQWINVYMNKPLNLPKEATYIIAY